jgi:hypothetical protein
MRTDGTIIDRIPKDLLDFLNCFNCSRTGDPPADSCVGSNVVASCVPPELGELAGGVIGGVLGGLGCLGNLGAATFTSDGGCGESRGQWCCITRAMEREEARTVALIAGI